MTEHAKSILEKMKTSYYPELSFDFAQKLTNESERGAILIGTSKVEEYLENLVKQVLPNQTKKFKDKLFNYPGPLSSFSGKIELSYAFGVIDIELYNSLNALRQIRNKAAHSNEKFSLKSFEKEIEMIYNFEYGFPVVINELATDNLSYWNKENARKMLVDNNLAHVDFEKIWNDRIDKSEYKILFDDSLRTWKLAYGLTFLCLKIEAVRDEKKDKINKT